MPDQTKQAARPSKVPLPVVFGCFGTSLTPHERSFLQKTNPFGIILFKRNCADSKQVGWLIKEICQAVGRDDVAILIDQEGGRVSRLGPPHWPHFPAASHFGAMYQKDAGWGVEAIECYGRVVANELAALGFTINCAPVLDLFFDGATSALGDRTLSRDPAAVGVLARAFAETLMANGILPVIKHLPGHGRMKTDPHSMLPVIETSVADLEKQDFVPFKALRDLPIGMNSHAVFTAVDKDTPASLSIKVHQELIRKNIGFEGLMFSDDIAMKALHGLPGHLAQKALEAGADVVLHCSGDITAMEAIAYALKPMSAESWGRWVKAKARVKPADPYYDAASDNGQLDLMLGADAYIEQSIA